MFLGLPHQASRYYGTLLKSIERSIFKENHHPVAYYASALSLYLFEHFTKRRQIDSKYRPFKYHLLSIIRMNEVGTHLPRLESHELRKSCERLVEKLQEEKK